MIQSAFGQGEIFEIQRDFFFGEEFFDLWKIPVRSFHEQKSVGLPIGIDQKFPVQAFTHVWIGQGSVLTCQLDRIWNWKSHH